MSAPDRQEEMAIAPRKRRWLWPLLIVSLGFNLVFVGLVAGRIWTHGYGVHNDDRYRIFTGAVEKLMKILPDDKRQLAADLLKRHRETVDRLNKQKKREGKAAEVAVLTEPYDEASVATVLARFRQIRNSQHQSMHTMMMGLMKDLSLKERQELIKYILTGFRHSRMFWRRHGGQSSRSP